MIQALSFEVVNKTLCNLVNLECKNCKLAVGVQNEVFDRKIGIKFGYKSCLLSSFVFYGEMEVSFLFSPLNTNWVKECKWMPKMTFINYLCYFARIKMLEINY